MGEAPKGYQGDAPMSAILTTVIGGVLDKIIDKVTNQIPVTDNEKENIKVQAEKELANHAGAIAQAEAIVSTNAKDAWLAELHDGGFLATSWRPIAALCSLTIIVWDGIILNIINGILLGMDTFALAHTPAHISEVAMWILLTLIGARGIEKISVVRAKGK